MPQAQRWAVQKAPETDRPLQRMRGRPVRIHPPPRRVVMADSAIDEEIIPIRGYPNSIYRRWPSFRQPIPWRPSATHIPSYPDGRRPGLIGEHPKGGFGRMGWAGGRGMRVGGFGRMGGRGFGGGFLR
jgi:hypothetical protein